MITVIFACVHNAGRSQMAAAFFNQLADPTKARARSAGTAPGERVHPDVLDAMREVDIDPGGATPQRLTPELARDAGWLVTMGCDDACPAGSETSRDEWAVEDPRGKPVERVREFRDHIRGRVLAFVAAEGWG